jgi:hypothetical protein
MNDFAEKLKELRRLEPRPEFIAESKRLLFAAPLPKKRLLIFNTYLWENLGLSFSVSLVALIVILTLTNLKTGPASVADLDSFEKETKLFAKNIDITLEEVRYYNASAQRTALALNEAAENGPGHLNATVLRKEMEGFNLESAQNKNIEELLNKAVW